MLIVYGIIKKGYVADVLSDTSTRNNILAGTCWANKLEKFKNGSAEM